MTETEEFAAKIKREAVSILPIIVSNSTTGVHFLATSVSAILAFLRWYFRKRTTQNRVVLLVKYVVFRS